MIAIFVIALTTFEYILTPVRLLDWRLTEDKLSCQRLAPGGSWQSRVLDRPSPLANFDPAALLCSLSAAEVVMSCTLESSQRKSSVYVALATRRLSLIMPGSRGDMRIARPLSTCPRTLWYLQYLT